MDEEITLIDTNTRNEKIKRFFINNKNNFIIFVSIILLSLIGYFAFEEVKERNKVKLANEFNSVVIAYETGAKENVVNSLIKIVKKHDKTYSPLSLYFLIDNNLIDSNVKINELFDILIKETNLEKEIKNLVIYKKALFNSNFASENDLITILKPIMNSESIWKSHALYLTGEYFYSKNDIEKAKEFFNQILILPNNNKDIELEAKKRINRDLSE
jgi:predicted negative regulator of RcsB-dependent stress response